MAAPGFGFSFGDFVSAIKIVKDVSRALRDTGGAKDEFQHVLVDLNHLEILLEQLNYGTWDHGGDAGHLNAIKGMALTCKTPLQEFLRKIDNYKILQGATVDSFKTRLGSRARKIQWAVGMKEEVEKFRAVITAKIVSINLLIQLHTLSTISKLSSRDEPLAGLSIPFQTQIQGCRENIQQLSGQMGKVTLEQSDTKKGISTLVRICTGSKIHMENFQNLNRAQHKEVQQRFNTLERMHSYGNAIMVSNTDTIGRLDKMIRQLLVVFGGFPVTMLKLLRLLVKTDLQNYALLRELHCAILRAPVFRSQDSIQFTDALGRTEPLPYQYFQHWDIFDAMLRCKFKQFPGENLVAQGQYHLVDTKRKDRVIDRRKWEKSVFPGADISMSMVILGVLFNKGTCPRVACGAANAPNSIDSEFIICSKCNLEYRCFDISIQREPKNEAVIDQERNSPPAGGQDMFRDEGYRPQSEMKLNNVDFQMPPRFEISVEEELEAFKSIHIQTKPRSELSNEKQAEKNNENDAALEATISEENIDPPVPCLPIPSDESLRFPPIPESLIGMRLGESLEIKSMITTDNFAVTYSAIDHSNQTWYAVKALSKIYADGTPLQSTHRDFQRREMQLHYAASAHPNILSMMKIVDDGNCTYVVLHYCPDGDLFSNITDLGRYMGNDTLIRETFLQILNAVQHCHKLGIYHRDLKPENIFVDGTQVLLANFDLATTASKSDDNGCGSTFYMSPECLKESGTYQCAPNDIWSLGVILVNLTCSRNPFKMASVSDSVYRAYLRNRNFLKSILPLSNELNDILVKIFEPDVEKRITIEDLITAITDCSRFSAPTMTL